jgi:hypothetical protein
MTVFGPKNLEESAVATFRLALRIWWHRRVTWREAVAEAQLGMMIARDIPKLPYRIEKRRV